jgi:hypothetical protein
MLALVGNGFQGCLNTSQLIFEAFQFSARFGLAGRREVLKVNLLQSRAQPVDDRINFHTSQPVAAP